MAIDPATAPAAPLRPSLFVACEAEALPAGADAAIRALARASHETVQDDASIWLWTPGDALPASARVCVADCGLAAAASLARAAPALCVVPRVEVRRMARSFGFSRDGSGSGFHTYQLDPATAAAFTVQDAASEQPLADWLRRAVDLGFSEVWLHGSGGAGGMAEMLAQAHRAAPSLGFWVPDDGHWLRRVETGGLPKAISALVVTPQALADVTRTATAGA